MPNESSVHRCDASHSHQVRTETSLGPRIQPKLAPGQPWRGARVTVDVWDLHVLLAFTHSGGNPAVLSPDDLAAVNRVVNAVNRAKDAHDRRAAELPHSRACGIRRHEHGRECSSDCPMCGGKEVSA